MLRRTTPNSRLMLLLVMLSAATLYTLYSVYFYYSDGPNSQTCHKILILRIYKVARGIICQASFLLGAHA
jgi:hypothetical protein